MADKIIPAVEGSNAFITGTFTDRFDEPVIPNSITWSLTDEDGTVINSRSDISIAVPAASVTVAISGDDLPWAGNFPGEIYIIYFLFKAIYDEVDKSDVPANKQRRIGVTNLRGVS